MGRVNHWLAHTFVTAPEDLADYSVNKVITVNVCTTVANNLCFRCYLQFWERSLHCQWRGGQSWIVHPTEWRKHYWFIYNRSTPRVYSWRSGNATLRWFVIVDNSAGGVDYESAPVFVQFNQTDDRRCFHITIIDDFNRETAETFEVGLLANAGVTIVDPSLATVTIIDDDTNRK